MASTEPAAPVPDQVVVRTPLERDLHKVLGELEQSAVSTTVARDQANSALREVRLTIKRVANMLGVPVPDIHASVAQAKQSAGPAKRSMKSTKKTAKKAPAQAQEKPKQVGISPTAAMVLLRYAEAPKAHKTAKDLVRASLKRGMRIPFGKERRTLTQDLQAPKSLILSALESGLANVRLLDSGQLPEGQQPHRKLVEVHQALTQKRSMRAVAADLKRLGVTVA